MERNKKIVVVIILIVIIAIAIMVVFFANKPTIANNSSQDQIQITAQSEEDVDKDNSTAQNNESAVQSDGKDSEKTVKKNTSNTSTSSNKDTTKNTNSTSTTSKNETSKPTSSNKPTSSSKPSTPQHTHSWTAVYKEVDKGYYDTVTKKVAYTKCHLCGADITNNTYAHMDAHMDNGEVGSYGTAYRYYEEKVWIPNIVKEVDYYKCSCGATK